MKLGVSLSANRVCDTETDRAKTCAVKINKWGEQALITLNLKLQLQVSNDDQYRWVKSNACNSGPLRFNQTRLLLTSPHNCSQIDQNLWL